MSAPRPVLVGCSHGTADPAGRATIHALLADVARARPDLDVREAFVDVQEPRVATVVADALGDRGVDAPSVVVVPLLLSGGFHVPVDIAQAVGGTRAVAAAPLGPDPRLVELLDARLAQAGAVDADAVVLAAAGSSDARSVAQVEEVVRLLAARRDGPVTVGYGSAAHPRVPDAVAVARADAARRAAVTGTPWSGRVVIASYLLAPGYFHDRLQEAGADLVTAPLGPDPRLARVVLARYDEALRGHGVQGETPRARVPRASRVPAAPLVGR